MNRLSASDCRHFNLFKATVMTSSLEKEGSYVSTSCGQGGAKDVNICIQLKPGDYRPEGPDRPEKAPFGGRGRARGGLKQRMKSTESERAKAAEGCLPRSDFRIEVEERVKAPFELGFNLFARALDHMHGYVSLMAVCQFEGCVLDFSHFTFG